VGLCGRATAGAAGGNPAAIWRQRRPYLYHRQNTGVNPFVTAAEMLTLTVASSFSLFFHTLLYPHCC
jgi:hypothetical protein